MPKLDLSAFNPKLRKINEELWIYDPIRRNYFLLTPEEWVRQRLLLYLLEVKQYPKALIRLESGLKYNKRQKRSDLLVYQTQGSELKPWLLLECKAESTPLDEKVLRQALTYNKILTAPYLVITNGQEFRVYYTQDTELEGLDDFPVYPSP